MPFVLCACSVHLRVGKKKVAKLEFGTVVPLDVSDCPNNSGISTRKSRMHSTDLQHVLKVGKTFNEKDFINDTDILGMTPLMRFARRPRPENVVEALMAHRANIDTQDTFGNTALLYACNKKQQKTVNALLAMGARSNIRNMFGETAQEVAKKNCLEWPETARASVAPSWVHDG